MNVEFLTTIIETFIPPQKQARLLNFLWSDRRYTQLLHELLNDPRIFIPRTRTLLAEDERSVDAIYQRLHLLGADDLAYLVGDCPDYEDGATADLRTLLEACVGSEQDALIYCPTANAAYYEGHQGFPYLLAPVGR